MNALKHFSGERKNRLGVGEENWGLPVFSFCIYIKRKYFIKARVLSELVMNASRNLNIKPINVFYAKN